MCVCGFMRGVHVFVVMGAVLQSWALQEVGRGRKKWGGSPAAARPELKAELVRADGYAEACAVEPTLSQYGLRPPMMLP
jgi:hypothetical protein